MNNQPTKQEVSLATLIPFGNELLKLCEVINLYPVVYGSLAYIFHTGDKDIVVNDIDFLVPKNKFQDLINIIQRTKNLTYEETNYNSVKVFKNKIKVSFDSIDDYLFGIDFQTIAVMIAGEKFEIVDKRTLQEVYERGVKNIPSKKEAYMHKLERLLRGN